MGRVILTRAAAAVPLLFTATLLSFLLVYWAPGTFLDHLRLSPGMSESVLEELERRYGLDRPLHVQYGSWLRGLAAGDFGPSLAFDRPVADLLVESVPRTLVLAALAHLASLLLGTLLALAAVRRLGGAWDRFGRRAALGLLSIHPVVLALLGLSFAAATRAFPIGGGSSPEAVSASFSVRALDYGHHLVLPAVVLVLVMLPPFYLHARGVLTHLVPSSFVRAGRARGLSENALLFWHLLPAALPPLVSYGGASLGRLLSAAFLVEVVTGWPGMGRLALTALHSRDPFLLLGTLVVAGAILSLGNLLSDLLLAEVDPRIRLEERAP